jgi:hypothetical protein
LDAKACVVLKLNAHRHSRADDARVDDFHRSQVVIDRVVDIFLEHLAARRHRHRARRNVEGAELDLRGRLSFGSSTYYIPVEVGICFRDLLDRVIERVVYIFVL